MLLVLNYNVKIFSVGDLTNFHRGIKINTLDVFHNEIGVVVLGYTSIHHMNDVGLVILARINDSFSKDGVLSHPRLNHWVAI